MSPNRAAYRSAQLKAAIHWQRAHLLEASLLREALTVDGITDEGTYIFAASHQAGLPGFVAWSFERAVSSGQDAAADQVLG